MLIDQRNVMSLKFKIRTILLKEKKFVAVPLKILYFYGWLKAFFCNICHAKIYFVAKVNADFANLCDCPIACESEQYDVKLSYAQFPNTPYGRELGEKLNITLPTVSAGTANYDSKTQYIR